MTTTVLETPPVLEVLVPMAPTLRRAIERIATHDFSVIRGKILKEDALPLDVVDQAIDEFRRFFILIRLGYTDLGMPSKVVDEVWHTFILFTRMYHAFCDEVMGGYVHHLPCTIDEPIPTSTVSSLYAAYEEAFGFRPGPLWRDDAAAECGPGCGHCMGDDGKHCKN
ncbi:MAG: hypothetical protein RI947_1378 [Candidatus Parcubacteria bacterium]